MVSKGGQRQAGESRKEQEGTTVMKTDKSNQRQTERSRGDRQDRNKQQQNESKQG